jgi:hypothetical protein
VDKPLSPQAEKTTLEPSTPPSLKGAQSPINAKGTLTSLTHVTSSQDAAHDSPRPEPTELPEISPPSPWSHGLGPPGRPQPGEGLSVPLSKKQLRQYSCVAESLWDHPDFIQAEFHIGR